MDLNIVSDLLLSDMLRTSYYSYQIIKFVSDLLLSDKRKHPLTALIGNERMFFYLGVSISKCYRVSVAMVWGYCDCNKNTTPYVTD